MSQEVEAYVKGGQVAMLDPAGMPVWVPQEDAGSFLETGYQIETQDQSNQREALEREAEEFDSPGLAALAGLARSGTFGLSDLALTKLAGVSKRDLRGLKEYNPYATGLGEAGGVLASALIPGGPLAGLGALGKGAGAVTKLGLGALEGAAIGAGQQVSDIALSEREMSVDDIVSRVARGAGTGAALGAGMSLASMGVSSLARFASNRGGSVLKKYADGAGKETQKLKSEVERLTADVAKARASGEAAERILEKEAQLASAARAASAAQSSVAENTMAKYITDSASRETARMVGSMIGGVAGYPGYIVGGWVGPKAAQAVKNYIAPIASSAAVKKAAKKTMESVRPLTVSEFHSLVSEVESLSPEGVYESTVSSGQGMPQVHAEKIAKQNAEAISLIKESMPVIPDREIPKSSKPPSPSRDQLRRLTRVLKAVSDPESALVNFSMGKMSVEEAKVLNRVYGEDIREIKDMIANQVEHAKTSGKKYTRKQAEQIKRLMGPQGTLGSGAGFKNKRRMIQGIGEQKSEQSPKVGGLSLSRPAASGQQALQMNFSR